MAEPNASDPYELLATALRTRAATIADLAAAADSDEHEVLARVHELERLELIRVSDGALSYRRPDLTVARMIRQTLDDAAGAVEQASARTQHLVSLLAELAPSPTAADVEGSIPIEVTHGPWALADMWRVVASPTVPRSAWICLPDTELLRETGLDYDSSFWAAREGGDSDVRVILSIHDARAPINELRLSDELAAGTRARMHPAPPSYFWITDHDTVTLPAQWGDEVPSGAIAIRSPVIASAFRWVYERVWEEALPVDGAGAPWDPMLRLMNSGLTMEAAASALGLAPRTGRRRVEAAMRHFGADSHFSLGVAWGRAQGSAPSTG